VLLLETPAATTGKREKSRRGSARIFTKLAFQNLLRRTTRTFMLIAAVAIGTGALLSSFVVERGIDQSMAEGFARMGADLVVVPEDAMVNITSALLTVQPTDATIDKSVLRDISRVQGIAQLTPQTIYRVPFMSGMPEHQINLIAFDPASDFTVIPWLADRLPRALQPGDIIIGARRPEAVGEEIQPGMVPATIYGKLGRSGVGPFDDSLFATYNTVTKIAHEQTDSQSSLSSFSTDKVSAVLIRLAFGATPEQVRFSLAQLPKVKVISGATIVTSTRQTMSALMLGVVAFTATLLFGSLILIGLLFSAIIEERRREIGLLLAIGARRFDIVSMLVAEALFATIIGGVCGILFGCGLLLAFRNSLVYYLETLKVQFAWPSLNEICLASLACLALTALLGLLGSIIPAWRTSRQEPHVLISGAANADG
jgi:putative ABC transport system permease protein